MHEAMEDRMDELEHPLGVRIGINYGPTLLEKGDVFGDSVKGAERVVNMTKVQQILCTGQLMEALEGRCPFDTRCLGRTAVKELKGEIEIHEIIWKQEDLTSISMSPMPTPQIEGRCLQLEFEGKNMEVGPRRLTVTLGRGTGNDLVSNESLASRYHARIEYRHGKFLIQDQSTNGTFVRTEDGRDTVLHREEFLLQGKGLIGLGRAPEQENPNIIHFQELEKK
jgi:pSer/pThr/pTyr-binding forkhead associated (FHA) protein